MIVKVRTHDGWMLFEGDRVYWKVVSSEEPVPCYTGRVYNLTFVCSEEYSPPDAYSSVRLEISIGESEDNEIHIFTQNVVYILNNEGKTIEKL
jgi:hypothetical protein